MEGLHYFCRQHCPACHAATDWYEREAGGIVCGGCAAKAEREAAWAAGWLALTDGQRSWLKFLRWRVRTGRLSEGVLA